MAYNALNNLIDAYIYANGVQAITGQILNGVLKQMVSQLGSGYHLMGVATPQTVPATDDYAMAYFAATAGEYTVFGGITLAAGEVAVLLTSGNGSWSKQTIYNVPTGTADLENTAEFITNAVTDLVNYYTKTEIDTTLADYPTLEDLATALADYYTKTEIDTILAGYTTNTALASALADYYNKNDIDGLLSVVNAALADRYTKDETDTKLADYYKKTETYDKDEVDSIVATLSRQEYIVAWDGLAAPDVTAIPAGVTVTYSGTTYTGTLAASASTVNKIYMVWNGTAYDMYGTSQDGGYSWVPMGTTTVDLSQYATKAEVSQLEAELGVDKKVYEYSGAAGWSGHCDFPLINGHTYIVQIPRDSNTGITAIFAYKNDGTLVGQYNFTGMNYYGVNTNFTATADSDYFIFYKTSASGQKSIVEIYDKDGVYGKIGRLGANISGVDSESPDYYQICADWLYGIIDRVYFTSDSANLENYKFRVGYFSYNSYRPGKFYFQVRASADNWATEQIEFYEVSKATLRKGELIAGQILFSALNISLSFEIRISNDFASGSNFANTDRSLPLIINGLTEIEKAIDSLPVQPEQQIIKSSNLFDIGAITENKTINETTGELTDINSANVSDFIDVHGLASVVFGNNGVAGIVSGNIWNYAFYNANKAFVSVVHAFENDVNSVTIPSGAYYLRFTYFRIYDATTLQINAGTIKPYEGAYELYYTDKAQDGKDWVFKAFQQRNTIRVGKGVGYDFNEIQSAIDSIIDDSQNNRYTIIIYPGDYSPVSTIDSNRVRYISLIGIDRDSVRIVSNTGNYHTPAFEERIDGTIQNISFVMATDNEHYDPDSTYQYAYAVHTDFVGARKTLYLNCYFESNSGPAVGCGTKPNHDLQFESCVFVRKSGFGADLGAFFAHTIAGETAQKLFVRNSYAKDLVANTTRGGFFLALLDGTASGSYEYTLQNCGSFDGSHPLAQIETAISYLSYNNTPSSMNP